MFSALSANACRYVARLCTSFRPCVMQSVWDDRTSVFLPVAFRVGCRRPGTRPHDAIHGPHVFRALRAVMLTFLQLISSRSIPAGVVGRKDYLKGTKITATR